MKTNKIPRINSIAALREHFRALKTIFQVHDGNGVMKARKEQAIYEVLESSTDSCLRILGREKLYHWYDDDSFDQVASTPFGFQLLKNGKVVREYKLIEAYDNSRKKKKL
jgi:hypothetical protein